MKFFKTLTFTLIIGSTVNLALACSGTTSDSCTSQTWTQNSCTGNAYCNGYGGAVTQSQCNASGEVAKKKGLPGCTWSTQQVACTWTGSCCTTGGSCS